MGGKGKAGGRGGKGCYLRERRGCQHRGSGVLLESSACQQFYLSECDNNYFIFDNVVYLFLNIF